MGALGVLMGVFVGGGVVSVVGSKGDGVGEARFKKCSFLIGEENSSEDEELKLMVCCGHIGLTLIRAVLLIGLVDGEVKDDLVMLEVKLENA